jgi:hypothetical protein
MTPFDQQFAELKKRFPLAESKATPGGGFLVEIPDYKLCPGWYKDVVRIIFLAPPGYPAAQPDCFWVEPPPVRLTGGGTPQGTNDSNPIPGVGPRGTWFSWHLQKWNPGTDTLLTYVNVIERRLCPPR